MTFKRGFLSLIVILLLSSLSQSWAQSSKQVWVFYMGYWTLDGWTQSENVLTDEPISRYNSRDPNTAASHIQQAQNTGIDAFIVSWFGKNDANTTGTLNTLLEQASGRGFKIGVAVDSFPSGTNRTQAAMIESLDYLINDRAQHPAYLRFDGKPVIYFAFQEETGFSNATWQTIRQTVDPNRETIWVAEGLNGCCLHNGVFDGLFAFNLAWGDPATTATTQFERLRNAGGYFYTPTVHPGWDERKVAARDSRPNPTAPRDRANGQFLTNSWNGAVASNASIILIVSWNEFMEGSHIEPSQTYGSQALDTLRPLIADWKAGRTNSPAQTAPPAESAPVAAPPVEDNPAPTGATVTINAESMNVRSEPNTTSAVVAGVFRGETYAILGEFEGWYRIEVNGKQGYVAGDYVVVSQ